MKSLKRAPPVLPRPLELETFMRQLMQSLSDDNGTCDQSIPKAYLDRGINKLTYGINSFFQLFDGHGKYI
ncbi:hypothetical protein GQ457_03G025380 [Hibiscus cannabinus]